MGHDAVRVHQVVAVPVHGSRSRFAVAVAVRGRRSRSWSRLALRGGRLLLAAALSLPSGCGYSLGFQVSPGVTTVAVPVFLNDTFPLRREIEFELTSAFRQELLARTDLRLVDETGNPDLVVRGRILEFRERVVAEGRLDQKLESSVVARIELRIENYLDQTTRILEPISSSEPFSVQAGETFQDGRRKGIRNLAERLVVRMEDWEADDDPLEVPEPVPSGG